MSAPVNTGVLAQLAVFLLVGFQLVGGERHPAPAAAIDTAKLTPMIVKGGGPAENIRDEGCGGGGGGDRVCAYSRRVGL